MDAAIYKELFEKLRDLGFVASGREFARLLGHNEQWLDGLRRRDGRQPHRVRQSTAMRLRRRLLAWQSESPRAISSALGDLVLQLDAADATARWLAR